MSGGVDSSVAAHLLLRAGHEVVGVFMRHGEPAVATCYVDADAELLARRASEGGIKAEGGSQKSEVRSQNAEIKSANFLESPPTLLPIISNRADHKQGCCSASDAEDARRVADRLNIPFYAVDFQDGFDRIIDYFVDEYTHGRTPNPCVMCNNWLKFGQLFDYADSVGAEFVATGHYARLVPQAGSSVPALSRGVDDGKDQSYVLFGIDQSLLQRMMLPVGDYRKDEIRQMAHEIGLRVADKRDSQEICFVADGDHANFVRRKRAGSADEAATTSTAGEFVLTDGSVVGRHDGIEGFTIGQRKGLGIALGDPHYVVRIEPESRRVVIGTKDQLARTELTAANSNWLIDVPATQLPCTAKIRYNTRSVSATVTALPNRRLQVTFDEPQFGIAPGQAVVCYHDDRVLCGGWIE
jgi:tRNA-specific 2-thiouridylase